MISAWTKNLKTDADKADFENRLRGARLILERLKELVDEKENTLDRGDLSISAYNTPGWDYKQADSNGYRRCLGEFKTLLTLDQQKETK